MAVVRAAINNHAGLIWAIADLPRGDYKRAEYQKVILPLVLLRRLDCVLEPTKDQVLARAKTLESESARNVVLKTLTGVEAYNTSSLTLFVEAGICRVAADADPMESLERLCEVTGPLTGR